MVREQTASETAAENLRLCLPLMARYQIPVTPPNYAVWYEYVAGGNEALTRAIDDLRGQDREITAEITGDLYHHHVIDATEKKLTKTRIALRSLLEDIGTSVAHAGEEVAQFEANLGAQSGKLRGDLSLSELAEVVEELTAETKSVREAEARLQTHLEESRRETEALRTELERARHEATTDSLTGLLNRKAFMRALDEQAEAARESAEELCLLMADIDEFKRINDTYGHLLGDKVIRFVAGIVEDSVKGRDLVCRFGGEEYAVLLPSTTYDGACAVAENIRAAVEMGKLVRSDTREPIGRVTISLGVSLYRPGEGFDDFIARADGALYESKRLGRNRVTGEKTKTKRLGRNRLTGDITKAKAAS